MKHLYLCEDNVMNYLFIRDMSRADDDTVVLVCDLSDDEIAAAVADFKADENVTPFVNAPLTDCDYEPFSDVIDRMNTYKCLI